LCIERQSFCIQYKYTQYSSTGRRRLVQSGWQRGAVLAPHPYYTLGRLFFRSVERPLMQLIPCAGVWRWAVGPDGMGWVQYQCACAHLVSLEGRSSGWRASNLSHKYQYMNECTSNQYPIERYGDRIKLEACASSAGRHVDSVESIAYSSDSL
jgi:hypothetical protein